jgi:V/A-type H+-transporting ATPase subunit K
MSNKGTWIFGAAVAVLLAGFASPAFAQSTAASSGTGPLVAKIFLGLGLSLALSGSAVGLSISFSALLGGGTENFYKIIPVALMPGSQGIYGIVVFFTNLDKFDSDPYTVAAKGAIAGMAMLLSAWYQGIVCAAGIRSILEGRNTLANALVSGAMPETYAVFALVMTFIIK